MCLYCVTLPTDPENIDHTWLVSGSARLTKSCDGRDSDATRRHGVLVLVYVVAQSSKSTPTTSNEQTKGRLSFGHSNCLPTPLLKLVYQNGSTAKTSRICDTQDPPRQQLFPFINPSFTRLNRPPFSISNPSHINMC